MALKKVGWKYAHLGSDFEPLNGNRGFILGSNVHFELIENGVGAGDQLIEINGIQVANWDFHSIKAYLDKYLRDDDGPEERLLTFRDPNQNNANLSIPSNNHEHSGYHRRDDNVHNHQNNADYGARINRNSAYNNNQSTFSSHSLDSRRNNYRSDASSNYGGHEIDNELREIIRREVEQCKIEIANEYELEYNALFHQRQQREFKEFESANDGEMAVYDFLDDVGPFYIECFLQNGFTAMRFVLLMEKKNLEQMNIKIAHINYIWHKIQSFDEKEFDLLRTQKNEKRERIKQQIEAERLQKIEEEKQAQIARERIEKMPKHEKWQLCVYGYLRLHCSTSFLPDGLKQLCLLMYAAAFDVWDMNISSDKLQLNADCSQLSVKCSHFVVRRSLNDYANSHEFVSAISNRPGNGLNAFGTLVIGKGEFHEWKFKLSAERDDTYIFFGIMEADKCASRLPNVSYLSDKCDDVNYLYGVEFCIWPNGDYLFNGHAYLKTHRKRFTFGNGHDGKGDVLTMSLDMTQSKGELEI